MPLVASRCINSAPEAIKKKETRKAARRPNSGLLCEEGALLMMQRTVQIIALFGVVGLTLLGQDQVSHQVEIKQGTVVYVSGNDLVVKETSGKVKHFTVPDGYKFHVDGKDITIGNLKPGTHLTQTITTTTTDRTVTSVRNVDATVWQVNPPYLFVTMPDGSNKQVKVPEGTKFIVDGQEKPLFQLDRGMRLKGTIVTETPETVVSSVSKVTGKAPVTKAVATPRIIGVLLFEEPTVHSK